MRLSDLLGPDQILVDLEAMDLTHVLKRLLGVLPTGVGPSGEVRDKFARDLAFGSAGEVVRLTPEAVAVLGPREDFDRTRLVIGRTRAPFKVTGEGRGPPGAAQLVFLFLTPGRLARLRGVLPGLTRFMRQPEHALALSRASDPAEILDNAELMSLRLDEELRVETALTPVSYRVYPDTPLDEVVDLIIRRELHAVPVVGEGYQVMGIITAGDALRDLLPRQGGQGEGGGERGTATGRTARDIMTRTVMCVSEDQLLRDAATLMVNRDVEQLPVVREGELIGLLTRDAVLRVLYGR